jgi:hypothetical protein
MTTVAEIIEEAFREASLTAEIQSATPTQTTQALARLQNVVSSAYGFEVGEPLTDWPIGLEGVEYPHETAWSDDVWERPRINTRLIAASATAQTVFLPERPYDGSRIALIDPASRLAAAPITLDGNGRTIEGAASLVVSTSATRKIWFYRADMGNWLPITPLVYADTFPFPEEFDDYFITQLAMRLNPRYGRSMTQESLAAHARSLALLQARYRQSENVGVAPGLLRLSENYAGGDAAPLGASPVYYGDRGWMN